MNAWTVGIVGAGQMGAGIAHVASAAAFDVILTDIEASVLDRAVETIGRNLDRQIKKGAVTPSQRDEALQRITRSTRIADHRRADLVIESAEESYPIKAEIFRQLDSLCPPSTILASNTSSISITKLAAATGRPDRVIGMHFMNPVPLMRLVEVVRGLETSDETVRSVLTIAESMGKIPVACDDHPGFVSNRLLMPMINEAVFAVAEGVASADAVDRIMTLGMNHPMGPLHIADLIGLDNCLSVMRVLHAELGDPKYRPCPLLVRMVDAGHLGRKSGRGFFDYREE